MTTTISSATPASTTSRIPPFSARLRTALGALYTLAGDPGRLDTVLVFTQAVNAGALVRAADRITATEEGRRLLERGARIDRVHVDYEALRRLPDGTLGREYARFLDDNAIGPEPFEKLPDTLDPRVAWIMLRMRQTHDLWHVLTGYAPDVRGEVLLQVFTWAQTRVPSALLLALFGSLRWLRLDRAHLRAVRHAYGRGKTTRFLPTFRWEEHWTTPVSELRTMLDCPA